jgi:hypothetical protein
MKKMTNDALNVYLARNIKELCAQYIIWLRRGVLPDNSQFHEFARKVKETYDLYDGEEYSFARILVQNEAIAIVSEK